MHGMDDPKAAVVAFVTRPAEEPHSARQGAGGWTSRTGGHVPARPESIRFAKERLAGDLAMVAFEYVDVEDREWHGWLGAERVDGAWKVNGGASGSGTNPPRSSAQWANFGCMWGERQAMAGGRVHGEGVARVRLLSDAGGAVEDSVDEGVALLMFAGRFPRPWTVELYDAAGALLRSHPCPGGRT
jgi:hypothetical protein